MKTTKEIFQDKYNNNSWKGSESRSGPGSSIKNTYKLLVFLEDFVKIHSIETFADCACGDFYWMKNFNFTLIKNYLGMDIVEDMILFNSLNFKYITNVKFETRDIINYQLGYHDLIMCKDCLFHLSFADALSAIDKFKKSGSKYLLATTFVGFKNIDIPTGNWRRIDMATEPFNLGEPFELLDNSENLPKSPVIEKSIGVWRIN